MRKLIFAASTVLLLGAPAVAKDLKYITSFDLQCDQSSLRYRLVNFSPCGARENHPRCGLIGISPTTDGIAVQFRPVVIPSSISAEVVSGEIKTLSIKNATTNSVTLETGPCESKSTASVILRGIEQ